ncbi:hypothetical protein SSS_02547 [Sarcoptes scabiei]|uniref:Uncharacterized protein n=1 Tax=Sarcoptes scabiei TaxID=52283 RepID=A0A834R0N3_SARSC|nr:hypothetical protein SSS_02547 [Sarcoptes scabiei]
MMYFDRHSRFGSIFLIDPKSIITSSIVLTLMIGIVQVQSISLSNSFSISPFERFANGNIFAATTSNLEQTLPLAAHPVAPKVPSKNYQYFTKTPERDHHYATILKQQKQATIRHPYQVIQVAKDQTSLRVESAPVMKTSPPYSGYYRPQSQQYPASPMVPNYHTSMSLYESNPLGYDGGYQGHHSIVQDYSLDDHYPQYRNPQHHLHTGQGLHPYYQNQLQLMQSESPYYQSPYVSMGNGWIQKKFTSPYSSLTNHPKQSYDHHRRQRYHHDQQQHQSLLSNGIYGMDQIDDDDDDHHRQSATIFKELSASVRVAPPDHNHHYARHHHHHHRHPYRSQQPKQKDLYMTIGLDSESNNIENDNDDGEYESFGSQSRQNSMYTQKSNQNSHYQNHNQSQKQSQQPQSQHRSQSQSQSQPQSSSSSSSSARKRSRNQSKRSPRSSTLPIQSLASEKIESTPVEADRLISINHDDQDSNHHRHRNNANDVDIDIGFETNKDDTDSLWLDMGAYSSNQGSFGWYTDTPVVDREQPKR